MAENQEYRTKPNGRVRIKSDMTHMYRNARAYNEAIVRAQAHDDMGYPLIYVEWDRNHWAYSGEDDGWAIEAHFDPVEEDMPEDKDLLKALAALVQNFQGEEKAEEKSEPEPEKDDQGYEETLKQAVSEAYKADAFVILVASPEESPGGVKLIVPHVYMHSKRDDAALILDATMADASAQAYARLVLELIAKAKRDGQASS